MFSNGSHRHDRAELLLTIELHALLHREHHRRVEERAGRRPAALVHHARALLLRVADALRQIRDLIQLGQRRDADALLPRHADLEFAQAPR